MPPQSRIEELPPYVGARPRPLPAEKPAEAPKTPTRNDLRGLTIVVDAGHGGRDPGALGVGPAHEKVVTLNVALKLGSALRDRGARVVMTRESDRYLTLDERAAIADRTRADLFVSIHADSAQRAGANGATLYIARGASSASVHAGDAIVRSFKRDGIVCRGVRAAGYRVLVGHSRPAVLVECGFLTNRADAYNLSTDAYQQRIAKAISNGVAEHFGAAGSK